VLVSAAFGSQTQDQVGTPLSSFGAICEKASIWSQLTEDSTVDGIRNINFEQIKEEGKSQLANYQMAITNAQNEIKLLKDLILQAEEKEKTVPATEEEIDGLINEATEPFKGKATETECGFTTADRAVRKLVRGAYEASVDKMKVDAAEFFTAAPKSLHAATFMTRCASLLGAGMYCNHLCGELKGAAASHATTGAVTASSELIDKLNALQATVATNLKKKSVCTDALEELARLEGVIEAGKVTIDERAHAALRARWALEDAQDGLADMSDELETQETQLQELEKELEANTAEVATAKESLEAKKQKEEELSSHMKSTITAMGVLDKKLGDATEADKSVQELIRAVSALTTKMWLYFEDAALRPMRRHGISLDLDLAQYFSNDIKQLGEAGMLEKAVDGLDAFCRKEALPAFQAVKKLDLTPLCATGDAPSMKSSIYDAIDARVADVKALIMEAKSWTDPFKSQSGVTKEAVAEYVKRGEIEGLRPIIGVFQHAKFYHYLQGWKKDGKFLELIAMLKKHMNSLDEELKKLNAELEKLKELIAAAAKAREAAENSLQDAQQAKGLSEQAQAQLAKMVTALQDEGAQAETDLADLQAKLDAAEKALKAAQEALVTSHALGTKGSLLQTMLEETRLNPSGYEGQALQDAMAVLGSS